jgi:hypothetical protein
MYLKLIDVTDIIDISEISSILMKLLSVVKFIYVVWDLIIGKKWMMQVLVSVIEIVLLTISNKTWYCIGCVYDCQYYV